MPPTPDRLYELLLACRFSAAQLDSITETAMGAGLTAITEATDPAERAQHIVDFARRYNLMSVLTATVLSSGADRPALQNLLLDDAMTLDEKATQNVALDLVKLESKVERLFDRMEAKLDAALTEMRSLKDTVRQPIVLSTKAAIILIITLIALVLGQVTVLAWVGALTRG